MFIYIIFQIKITLHLPFLAADLTSRATKNDITTMDIKLIIITMIIILKVYNSVIINIINLASNFVIIKKIKTNRFEIDFFPNTVRSFNNHGLRGQDVTTLGRKHLVPKIIFFSFH